MVAHTSNLSTEETEAGDLCKFKASFGYTVSQANRHYRVTIFVFVLTQGQLNS